MAKQIGIDDLIHQIDNELIVLSEASPKGVYKYYDFKTALRILNDLLQNEGYNEFRKRKVSELINVFDDLCHTIVETVCIYDLAYDKDRKVRLSQDITYNSITHEKTVSPEYETDVPPELQSHYEALQFPHYVEHILETVKIDYLLRTCKVDYSMLDVLDCGMDMNENPIVSEIAKRTKLGLRVLGKRDDFSHCFDVDINVILKHRISFEEYVRRLVAERKIVENISDNSALTLSVPADTEGHFSVNKPYKEMQRILTALQQQGFVSAETTIGTFYYRMTGQGTPNNDKIEWIKKGKKRKGDISKSSLVYFVEVITGRRVSKAKDCTNRIKDIFGLSLSSSTINRKATCEYKGELDCIINSR